MQKQNNKKTKTLVITGGHAVTTAVATVEELLKDEKYKLNIHWIGSKSAIEGRNLAGIESIVFPKLGVKLHTITVGRIQRKFTKHTIPSMLKIPAGMVHAFFLLGKIKPDCIVSFGGFAAFPVVVGGFLRGIPVVMHEQTIATGLANKLSSIFVTTIAISREESKSFFPEKKVVLTGNPVLSSIVSLPQKIKRSTTTTILVTCGSRGSQIINGVLEQALPSLTKKYKVIHLAGKLDFNQFKNLKQKLEFSMNYEVYDTVSPLEIAEIYKRSDIIISRAGANTISELMILKRPSIVIPIPWTRFNEQVKNAESLRDTGLAKVLQQDSLTAEILQDTVKEVDTNWETMIKNSETKYRILDAAASKRLSEVIISKIRE